MKLKRILSMVLALVMVLCMAACGGNEEPKKPDEDDKTPTNHGSKPEGPDNPLNPEDPLQPGDENKVEASRITRATPFSEGLAFVEYDKDTTKLYCIDKVGNIVFTLDNYYCYNTSGYEFVGGLAVVQQTAGDREYHLCDTKGNLYSPEDFGGDSFEFSSRFGMEMWQDGYILIQKTTTDFTGSVNELGILNSDLEYIVPLSADMNKLWEEYNSYKCDYYNGYLFGDDLYSEEQDDYIDDMYLDLRTGKAHSGARELLREMELEYESDFWEEKNDKIYDGRLSFFDEWGEPIIDLSQYSETLYGVGDFKNGLAGVTFGVEDAQVGRRYYFTIMGEDGSFKFEPIEVDTGFGGPNCKQDGEIFMVITDTTDTATVKIFNITGKTAEIELVDIRTIWTDISDGVILISIQDTDLNMSYAYYTTDLQPLF